MAHTTLQRRLAARGFNPGPIDGIVGPRTKAAAKDYLEFAQAPAYMFYAIAELGVTEIPGPEHNKRILEYHQKTSLKAPADEIAWCAAYANWVLYKGGVKGTNSAAARSFLTLGKNAPSPLVGDIGIWPRGNSSWQGHVGFVFDVKGNQIYLLGGNQSNRVSVVIYRKDTALGFRRVS
jgi:uncharacterized protein (TIGR02594 family)